MRLPTLVAIAIALVSQAAFGQSTNSASSAPGNSGKAQPRQSAAGVAAPRQIDQPDRAFVHAAATGGLAEVKFGRLAAQKATGRAVKEFADHMVRDYGAANDRLASLAKANGIALPDASDEDRKAMYARLEQSTGGQFDRAYIEGQIIEHQNTAQLFEYEIGSGENAELKKFASDLLPTVLAHLRMAKAIDTGMASQAKVEAPAKKDGSHKHP